MMLGMGARMNSGRSREVCVRYPINKSCSNIYIVVVLVMYLKIYTASILHYEPKLYPEIKEKKSSIKKLDERIEKS